MNKEIKFKYQIGQLIADKNRNFTIIDRKYFKKNNDAKAYIQYKIKCNICGFMSEEYYLNNSKHEFINEYWIIEGNINKGRRYINNYYNIEILYLWESDINLNLDLCEKLIQEYIEKDGILDNFHSFNYFIDKNGNLRLKDIIAIPYQNMTKQELKKYINLKVNIAS